MVEHRPLEVQANPEIQQVSSQIPSKPFLLLESQFPQQQDTQLSAEFRAINNPKIYSCDISYEGFKKIKIVCGNEGKGSALKGNKFNEEKMVPNSV